MAQFDESKVINTLHPEKAEVGKKYWYSDDLISLKKRVEGNDTGYIGELKCVDDDDVCIFQIYKSYAWEYLYPYEEPVNQRMTNRQFCEWYNRGNGQWKWEYNSQCCDGYFYSETNDNKEVAENIVIRSWDSDEWVKPTVDIYERDCKG